MMRAVAARSGAARAAIRQPIAVRFFADKAPKFDKESIKKEQLKEVTGTTGKLHRSNAEELINKRGVIKVKGNIAVCEGGGGALGHPIEYITLSLVKDAPAVCKYCGLRYEMDHDHGHGHH